jgi:hypothetical protein
MIEKDDNVLNDETINRTVNYDGTEKQITMLDQRFYSRNERYYPSVTYILSFIPKNKIFIDWVKEKGGDVDQIVAKASEEGKQVHNAIERGIKHGEEITWLNFDGTAKYSLEVWKMILKFNDFWKRYKPKVIGSEIHVFSDKYEYAGTIDLILELEGEIWIIDIKTSNTLPKVYHYQTAAYANAWNECFDKQIVKRGLLWLKSGARKEDKMNKKMQGKGWSLVESNRDLKTDFESFNLAYAMFRHEVEFDKPYSEIFPTSVKFLEYV